MNGTAFAAHCYTVTDHTQLTVQLATIATIETCGEAIFVCMDALYDAIV